MRNIWDVFSRDAARLFRVRKAWIVVVGIIFTPALYGWLNISAFWDPYSNTGNIDVAVVNLDEGASSDVTGSLDVGSMVVDELENNDQLGWRFMAENDALEAVKRGDVYAAIVIPEDFSRSLLSITTGDFIQPRLEYHVNEKVSAISPKITDVGASELDRQITSAFSEQVAGAAATALRDAGYSAEAHLLEAKDDTLSGFDDAEPRLAAAREEVTALRADIESSRESLSLSGNTIGNVDTVLADVQTAAGQAQTLVADIQTDVIAFTDATTGAYVDGTALLADGAADASVSVTRVVQALQQVSARADTAITDVSDVVSANGEAIERLQSVLERADTDSAAAERITDAVTALEERNATDQQLLADLQSLNSNAAAAAAAIDDTAGELAGATQDAHATAGQLRTVLAETVPALNGAMTALTTSAGAFSAALDAQRDQLLQAQQLLTGIDDQLVATMAALDSLDGNLERIDSGIQTAHSDVVALSQASIWSDLSSLTGLDTEQIAQFVASPVHISEHVVFPVSSYGSAMAALFTNLSLWIGAFVLMVIFKLEVDTEGVERLTVRQAYVGRFLLLAAIAAVQALVVCIGDLLIGVQVASAAAFVATGVFTSLVYLSVIYALCVAFGHVGRGLSILLVIMQIPGASGLYPIEMMPGFFRGLYPFLPFTYGIDAMRETIGGFYGGHYWFYVAMLGGFVVGAFILGLFLRRRLANLILMFNKQIGDTDLLISEKVHVTGAGYRLSDIIRALHDRQEYRSDVAARTERFTTRYPTLLRAAVLTGLVLTAILAGAAWFFPSSNATLLAVWLVLTLIIIGLLVTLEYVKESLDRAQQVASLDDAVLAEAVQPAVHVSGNSLMTSVTTSVAKGGDDAARAADVALAGSDARCDDPGEAMSDARNGEGGDAVTDDPSDPVSDNHSVSDAANGESLPSGEPVVAGRDDAITESPEGIGQSNDSADETPDVEDSASGEVRSPGRHRATGEVDGETPDKEIE